MHHMLKTSKNRYSIGDLHLPKKIDQKLHLIIFNSYIKLSKNLAYQMHKKLLGNFFVKER